MSTTPAAHLARVKAQNPSWSIERLDSGWYVARRDWHGSQQTITVPSLADLELRLNAKSGTPPRAADRLAEAALDVIDDAVARGELPG
ncbi:MAG TPA: hypothetical protein VMV92_16850 [Streptosporangiaceae bacterium]|nr:hypothetical protein [Streptosporangiaceae bacterium]